jgi:hypothetical protein
MAVHMDFLDESADGSSGFGRREKDIGIEENTHRLWGREGLVFLEPSGQLGLRLVELGDSLLGVNLNGHGDRRTEENALRRSFGDQVVLGPDTCRLPHLCRQGNESASGYGECGFHRANIAEMQKNCN